MQGRLVVIEGLDGSGKATQTALLCKRLAGEGVNVKTVSFPRYDSESSLLVRAYLGGHFGSDPDSINSYAASSFYSVDRYLSFKNEWGGDYNDGAVFVCDRYTTSNAVFQTPKLPKEQWKDYLDWLYDFEYNRLGIPAPDAVIYLDMPIEASQRLMKGRYKGDESKKDIHERNPEFQLRCRQAALYCCEHGDWVRISCAEGEEPLDTETISRRVYDAVMEKLGKI